MDVEIDEELDEALDAELLELDAELVLDVELELDEELEEPLPASNGAQLFPMFPTSLNVSAFLEVPLPTETSNDIRTLRVEPIWTLVLKRVYGPDVAPAVIEIEVGTKEGITVPSVLAIF
jgi:hypothetical protein